MGLFDSLMYPDNGNRANRTTELADDCRQFLFEIGDYRTKIDTALAASNPIIKEAYSPFEKDGVAFKPVTLGENWAVEIFGGISSIFVATKASQAVGYAAKIYLAQAGRIGEAALADLAGLPRWFEASKIVGGAAAAVAVQSIVDAVEGAVQRDHLRDAIHSLYQPRIELKKNEMVNAALLETVLAATMAYQTLTDTLPPPLRTKEILDKIATNLVDKNHFNVNAITDAFVLEQLAALDRSRGSWTNEDT
jgi:hypothetical protein